MYLCQYIFVSNINFIHILYGVVLTSICDINIVIQSTRYLEVEGTLRNTSRYLHFDISDVQNRVKYQSNNQISQMKL